MTSSVFGLCESSKLTASDPAEYDSFGVSVSISDELAIVGSPYNDTVVSVSGAAYVFERDSNGNWIEVQKLAASDAASNDLFGWSVSISGDRAIVGAYHDNDAGNWSGSAYIFERDETGKWNEIEKLTASDAAADDHFGFAVAVSGDRAIVGAWLNDDACPSDPNCDSGSAYIFERDASGNWNETNILTASDAASDDGFGYTVSVSGNHAIIGASGDDDAGNWSGSAYIYERDGSGNWGEVEKLTALDAEAGDEFGISVSISGDLAIIGASAGDDACPKVTPDCNSGSAYIFEHDSGGKWNEVQKITASDAAEFDYFGRSVAISGDHAIVGAYRDDDTCPKVTPDCNSGSVYIFEFNVGKNWMETQKVIASDATGGEWFGLSSAISGNRAIIGAYLDDDAGYASGSAYVHEPGQDCNLNGVCDQTDIQLSTSCDGNGNLIPDECEAFCVGDTDCDADVDVDDLGNVFIEWGNAGPLGDVDFDGDVDVDDLGTIFINWGPC